MKPPEDIVLEHAPVVLCQCLPPCLMPFRDPTGEWSPVGCHRPQGHEPPCDAEGPGDFTYRDPPEHVGPRLRMTRAPGEALWRTTCPRCHREYAIGAVPLVEDALAIWRGATPGVRFSGREWGLCRRCGRDDLLLGGICGSCGDDLREDAKVAVEDPGR